MKRIGFIFFLLISLTSSAQQTAQARVDSLFILLANAKEDINKIGLYVRIITTYNDFNKVEALKLEKPAMELARKLDSKTAEANVKNAIGRVYWRAGNFDLALQYHREAKEIFEADHNEDKIALTIRYIGQDYADGGKYPEALKHLADALHRYEKLSDKRNMAYAHELNAWVYRKQGNYVEAMKSGFAMLQLLEEVGDKNSIALSLSEIAENYINLANYSEALKYFAKSAEEFEAIGDRINMGYNHNLVGKVYKLMGNYSEALKNHVEALVIGKEVNDDNIMAYAYEGMAEVYKMRKDCGKALDNYLASAELFKKCSNRRDLALTYCNIGHCYRIDNNYTLARKYYDEAFVLSKELGSMELIVNYYRGVEILDSATGNWKDAYINHKNYILNRDSIFNQGNIKKMVQLQLKYEFDKKEAATKAEQEEKDLRQRKQLISLIVIALLILILAIVLYRSQMRKARTNLELKQKSESLEEENRQKTSILNIVSHDLKAPFSKIKGLTDIMQMTKDLNKTEKEEYISHIQSAVEQGNHLISNLLESQTIHHESNLPFLENTDVVKFIHDFQHATNGQLLKKQQQLQTQVELFNDFTFIDQHMLTRILDNLVSNASKFSDKGKLIYLRAWSEGATLNFSVRDEGPGISESDQKKMFKKFQMLSARPTAGEGSTGLGLSITKALVEKLKGTIRVKSKVGEGTEVVISFPA